MRKCPYCAEEIQDQAVYCKHCFKKVKGILFRRIVRSLIIGVIVGALIVSGITYKTELKKWASEVGRFFKRIGVSLKLLEESISKLAELIDRLKSQQENPQSMTDELLEKIQERLPSEGEDGSDKKSPFQQKSPFE